MIKRKNDLRDEYLLDLYGHGVSSDKLLFFEELLIREVSNLFTWEGEIEEYIPIDILERSLIIHGQVMFFDDHDYKYLALPCSVSGHDIYNQPNELKSIRLDKGLSQEYIRKVARSYTAKHVITDKCVHIQNILGSQSVMDIIYFYAYRMAMLWQSMDTNLLWQNIPPIIKTQDSSLKLSIDTMLQDIWSGEPAVVVDKALPTGNDSIQIGLANVPFLFNDLHKALQQVVTEFRSIIGINTSGTIKESGVQESEITANNQSTKTCLQVMYSQRLKACQELKLIYGLDVTVSIIGEQQEKEELENGKANNRAEDTPQD